MIVSLIFIFLLGLIFGSFLNCAVFRLKEKKGFVFGRSFCPFCKNSLSWQDLIPILSFVFLKRKCRYCKKPISWQYPLVEILTGLVFAAIFNFQISSFSFSEPLFLSWILNFQFLINFIYLLAVASFLIIIFIFDLKWYLIPDKILFLALGAAALFHIYSWIFNLYSHGQILNFFLSGAGACAFFLAIFLLTQGKAMGFGDVKLAFFMGFFLGWPKIIIALFLAFLIGAIIGLMLIIWKKKQLKSEIPFGPFLISGLFIALIWGDKIFNSYLSFFS